jgi:hypothetical protein
MSDNEGDFQTAQFHYQAALRSNANNADLLSDMGYSYLLAGDFQQGQQFLNEAIEIQPDHMHAANNLALLNSKQGDYEAAAQTLRRIHSQEETESRLAKLFPEGRPTPMEEESDSIAEAPVLSPLRAPELRPTPPTASATEPAHDATRVTSNIGISTAVVAAEQQVPTARFTGQVTAASNAGQSANELRREPGTPAQIHPSAACSGESHPEWNRMPVSFNGTSGSEGSSANAMAPANSQIVLTNASQDVPSRNPIPVGSDSTLSVNNAVLNSHLPSNAATSPSPAKLALVMGMNVGPASLFPAVGDSHQTTVIATEVIATPPPPSSVGLPNRAATFLGAQPPAVPARLDPTATSNSGTIGPAVPRPSAQYGAPQFPTGSTGPSRTASPGSLPQTPSSGRQSFRGEPFQAMP